MRYPLLNQIDTNLMCIAIILSELRSGGMERLVVNLSSGLALRNIQVKVNWLES